VSADRNNVSDALSQLAGAYEARAAQTQSLLRVWLGPLAVIAVGGMLGMCIIALFLPMVRMVESVSW
ncbi:MAG: type II secretion system F family protein, partial [Phycisphaerae bacterium]